MIVSHQFLNKNIYFPTWDVEYLFLGTFNPDGGEILNYYYGRQSNGFWKIIQTIFDPQNQYNLLNFEELKMFMVQYRIGCIDIIKSIEFPDERRNEICGKGYSDQVLFTVKQFIRTYQFDAIENFILAKNVRKIFSTWGKRDKPNDFIKQLEPFIDFCSQHDICFTPLPSPSGREVKKIGINTLIANWNDRVNNRRCNEPL